MNERFTSLLITLLLITPLYALEPANEQRLADVAERGVHVMPFDLEKTMHFFTKTTRGGIQQV
ncbi:MAG: aspartate carbamoyltransferase, partial [Nitrosomonas nitrosa]|nr:aspartate carbamoyltransferase [Nitrosomonas nitrosa]